MDLKVDQLVPNLPDGLLQGIGLPARHVSDHSLGCPVDGGLLKQPVAAWCNK